jgi:hypothetical protein
MIKNSYILSFVLVVLFVLIIGYSVKITDKDQKNVEYYRSCIIGFDEDDCSWNK